MLKLASTTKSNKTNTHKTKSLNRNAVQTLKKTQKFNLKFDVK